MAANFDQILSMFKINYLPNESGKPSSENFRIDDGASRWLWWWYRYFMENTDYEAYCVARREDDETMTLELEKRFPKIAELYDDWGDIHRGRPMQRNENQWKQWLYERRHLFFIDVPAVQPLALPAVEVTANAFALQIPTSLAKEEVVQLFTKFIDDHYASIQTSPLPKYQLYAPEGRIDQTTFQAVKKSFYVQTVSEHHEQYPTSNAGTGLEVMALELSKELGFSWELEPHQQEALENGTLSMLDLDSIKRQVGRYKSNFAAYVTNTIDGVFPKK
ncbi:hypothetical protein KW842_25200 [Duganella sp. sic0402]|uniref:hypothetical protein n=1 Tax=Duganella sp. sic0402 TaxID=2854786 RepID=UPI001C45DBFA|nr:hypothetical protein [Duganella sp. sic0402]MBV7539070.1 hypothetical protein [Duganella sp. sic0402]